MNKMIAIVDYGMGNLRSVQSGIEHVGGRSFITDSPDQILSAEAVILPGVGAFGDAIKRLKDTGLGEAFCISVQQGKPCMGICLGLQLLFSESEEGGLHRGLDLIQGRVVRFTNNLKVPHMGWNQLNIRDPNVPILRGIPNGSYMYFVHSYYVKPVEDSVVSATTEYGIDFAAVVSKGNLFGTQFHPEKSQEFGLRILKNFYSLI